MVALRSTLTALKKRRAARRKARSSSRVPLHLPPVRPVVADGVPRTIFARKSQPDWLPVPEGVKSGGQEHGWFPQPGPQEDFLAESDDIIVGGGGGGGGKTISLLLDFLRFKDVSGFRGVIFRRLATHLTVGGGLWDLACQVYLPYGAKANANQMRMTFPSGAFVEFRHLQYEHTKYAYQGAQFARIGFDEATHLTASQFWYLSSRLRTVAACPTAIRLTCNPDAESWLAPFLSWWIGPDGYADAEKCRRNRWLFRKDDVEHWHDTREEADAAMRVAYKGELSPDLYELARPKSVRFIPARVTDNRILTSTNPEYVASLLSLPGVERQRLLDGNWKVVASLGVFKKHWFTAVEALPAGQIRYVRAWDLAATEDRDGNDPCWTVGVLLAMTADGYVFVVDVVRLRAEPAGVIKAIAGVASQDKLAYPGVQTFFEEEGGSGGKFAASAIIKACHGCVVAGERVSGTGDKVSRAQPFVSQAEAGNVRLFVPKPVNGVRRSEWVDPYLSELCAWPFGKFCDQVDATSLAYKKLAEKRLITAATSEEVMAQLLAGRR